MEFHTHKAVVSQKAIITRADGKILMLQRNHDDMSRPNGWDFPGGTLEEMEDPIEGIKREVFEETEMKIDTIQLLHARSFQLHDGCWTILLTYTAHAASYDVTISHEHQEFQWVTKEEIINSEIPQKYKEMIIKISQFI